MGYALIKDLHLSLKDSAHVLVKPKRLLTEQNVGIHQLTDDEVSQGLTLSHMMTDLFQAMTNRVVIVNFDKIEIRKRTVNQTRINTESLRLFSLRNQYSLPHYKAHNTMQDAISTAELFLTQVAYMGNIDTIKLGELII